MKTAMKKLFSLVLVAVLLVGVMPFQAFADGAKFEICLNDNSVIHSGSLTAGNQYDPAQLIEGSYEFDWAMQYFDSSRTSGASINAGSSYEVDHDDIIVVFVKPVTRCGNCDSTDHATGELEYCPTCDKCGGHNESAYCTVLVNGVACGKAHCTDAHCPKCGLTDHDGTAHCNYEGCGLIGHTAEDHCDNCGLYTCEGCVPSTPVIPTTCNVCGKTEHDITCPGHPDYVPCDKCWTDPCTCNNCEECGAPEGTHLEDCSKHPDYNKFEMTTIKLDYNYKGAPRNGSFEAKKGDLLSDVVASIPAPTRDGHLFSHWTLDAEGYDTIKTEHVTRGMTLYAQWDDDLALGGHLTLKVNLNYDRKMAEPLTNIKKGTRMGDVLDYVSEPSRWGHKFMGWYWDRDCEDAVKDSDKIYKNDEIFAKWERRLNTNEMMLKIYLNGNTHTVAKVVDLYDYSKDGKITKSEVDSIVKKYYTAKSSSDDMDIDGLFTVNTWNNGKYSLRHADDSIRVDRDDETIIYVMVRDAKAVSSSSSATADSSNPKTGDMIMTPVIVLGASAACLAALFFLNKKRAY